MPRRRTYGAGAALPEAKELARHSGVKRDDAIHPHWLEEPVKGGRMPSIARAYVAESGMEHYLVTPRYLSNQSAICPTSSAILSFPQPCPFPFRGISWHETPASLYFAMIDADC